VVQMNPDEVKKVVEEIELAPHLPTYDSINCPRCNFDYRIPSFMLKTIEDNKKLNEENKRLTKELVKFIRGDK
jgi:hypothetical protein